MHICGADVLQIQLFGKWEDLNSSQTYGLLRRTLSNILEACLASSSQDIRGLSGGGAEAILV